MCSTIRLLLVHGVYKEGSPEKQFLGCGSTESQFLGRPATQQYHLRHTSITTSTIVYISLQPVKFAEDRGSEDSQ